jgi:Flp pilus assembly protein CpaB
VKRSNRLVILVGVLLAVLAFVGIVIVLNQPGPNGNGQEATTVKVTVATEDIDIGEPVTPDKATVKEVAPDAVLQTRIADPSLLTGRPALVAIRAEEQITQEKAGLAGVGVNNIEDSLLPGEKAIAFQVDRVTGIDFLIQRGDHIDVVMAQEVTPVQETQESIDARDGNPDLQPRYEAVTGLSNVRTVKTILQDKRVLYVSVTRVTQAQTGTASPSPGQAQGQPASGVDTVIIVFAGTDQDAELIKFAQRDFGEIGSLTALLRRVEDTDEEVPNDETTGITLTVLIEQYGVVIPDIVVLQPQETPAP